MIGECYIGDVRDGLRAFIAAGIKAQTCVTSPPYWGLRDYGTAGQIGLEPTIAQYVATMVEVFRLVRDVLADDGTLWLNLGDSYTGGNTDNQSNVGQRYGKGEDDNGHLFRKDQIAELPPKNLCGIPWRVAFALQADGWYLRSDIIWAKPNPMPESVTDRPTKAHEYLFLLAKQERYYYDAAAIAEPFADDRMGASGVRLGVPEKHAADAGRGGDSGLAFFRGNDRAGRNRRSVWTVATAPYSDAHFATFPPALIEPCILAGTSAHGHCPHCGKGWEPACGCNAGAPVPAVVLDPFMGSGTVAKVAQSLGRRWIGCELNPAYVEMQRTRAAQLGMELRA